MSANLFKHKSIIEVRFADVDTFGHVNNAKYLTYVEQARIKYFDDVVEWPYDWSKEGVILARTEINFIVPVQFKDEIFIMTRCSRLGNKSFDLQYRVVKIEGGKEILMADGYSVMVAFDYDNNVSIAVPVEWRDAVNKFEGNTL